jgi:hypothetical protein
MESPFRQVHISSDMFYAWSLSIRSGDRSMMKTVLTFTIAASAILLLAQTVSAAPLCLPGYYDSGGVCTLCLPGYYCPNDDTLHICGLGFYCPSAGSALPAPCPVGTTTIHSGSTTSLDCVPVCTPAPEVCDGVDNDCDGIVDECPPGETCSGGTCTAVPAVPEFPTAAVPIGILGAFAIVVLVAGKKLV